MAAMTKFTLSYAYPFISLTFVLIMLSAAIFFREPITPPKVFGIIAIVAGVIVGAKG
jgi:multidrug transporter EmrE-like cation transporter